MGAKTPHHNPVNATLQHLWKLEIPHDKYRRTRNTSKPIPKRRILKISRICAIRLVSPDEPFFPNDSEIAVKFTDTPEGKCTIMPNSLHSPGRSC